MAFAKKWSDEFVAEFLVACEMENAGNLRKTAREHGVPYGTARRWISPATRSKTVHRSLSGGRSATDKEGAPMPALPPAEMIARKQAEFTEVFQRIVQKYAKFIDEADLKDVKPNSAAVVLGIMFDKLQLMRGDPTQITQTQVRYMEPDSLKTLAREKLRVLEGGKQEATG